MAATLVIEHPIADYDAWKRAFDSDPAGREDGGVTRYAIYRPADDPDSVYVTLEFETRERAEAFLPRLEAVWERAGDRLGFGSRSNVRTRFLDVVERADVMS